MSKTWMIFFLILISTVSAGSVNLVLQEGEGRTTSVDGNSFEVYIVIIKDSYPDKVKFMVNGDKSPELREGESYNISSSFELTVNNLLSNEPGDVTGDMVDFTISKIEYCGDGVCQNNEDCTCQDCACKLGYTCEQGECVAKKVCGDNYCVEYETCPEDNCCKGIKVNFDDDEYNCGECFNKCTGYSQCIDGQCTQLCGNNKCEPGEDCLDDDCCNGKVVDVKTDQNNCGKCGRKCTSIEKCEQGKCIQICGNGVCESNENCESCPQDCKCEQYEKCREGICITYCGNNVCEEDETCNCMDCSCPVGLKCFNSKCVMCTDNIECNDKDACTQDNCEQNTCVYKRQSGCIYNNQCVNAGTVIGDNYCSVYNQFYSLKSNGESCVYNYECASKKCEGQCVTFVFKVIRWFRSWFD